MWVKNVKGVPIWAIYYLPFGPTEYRQNHQECIEDIYLLFKRKGTFIYSSYIITIFIIAHFIKYITCTTYTFYLFTNAIHFIISI